MESRPPGPRKGGEVKPFKLGDVIDSKRFKAEIKTHDLPEELEARLSIEAAEARFRRWKDLLLFLSVLIGLAVVAGVCPKVVLGEGSSPDDKK